MAELTIIGIPQSNFVWSTRIAANEKGVAYELDPATPHSDAVSAISPTGKIPVMRHGDVELCESCAIAGYIDNAFDGPALFPKEATARAETDKWVSLLNTVVDKACIRDFTLEKVAPQFFDRPTNETKVGEALSAMPALFDAIQAGITDAGYLGSDHFTYADADATPMLYYANMFPEGAELIAARPKLKSYLDAMMARPSVQRSAPPPPG